MWPQNFLIKKSLHDSLTKKKFSRVPFVRKEEEEGEKKMLLTQKRGTGEKLLLNTSGGVKFIGCIFCQST
ncbi:MAG: hypothetical protein M5F18_04040 [Asgard group archaeon]|nr:hypothetical protein [Asgard group archaeon]